MDPVAKLELLVKKTKIGAQKVNGSCTSFVYPSTDVEMQKIDGTTLDT